MLKCTYYFFTEYLKVSAEKNPLSAGILCAENFRRELWQPPGKTPAQRDDSHRASALLSHSVALQIEYDRLAAPEVAAAMMTIKHFSV